MKTAISLPDQLFDMAERVAAELKVSRSELYRDALEEFIRVRHSWVIREKLDEVFSDPDGGWLDPMMESHQGELPAIDEELLRKAGRLTGLSDRQALVRLALEALIARESARRLAELGGTQKNLEPIPRRRPDDS
jgi:metal-responsive CopG/Arc/MetJ family transcriptional regulator